MKNKKNEKVWYDAQAIREDADPVSVLAALGQETKEDQDEICFLCPVHPDRHIGNCSVSKRKKIWHCFSCGASGDIIGLAQKLGRFSYPEALAFVAEASGCDPSRYLKSGGEPETVRKRKSFAREYGPALSAIGLAAKQSRALIPVCTTYSAEETETYREAGLYPEKMQGGGYLICKKVRTPSLQELKEREPETYNWLISSKKKELENKLASFRAAVDRLVDDPVMYDTFLAEAQEKQRLAETL